MDCAAAGRASASLAGAWLSVVSPQSSADNLRRAYLIFERSLSIDETARLDFVDAECGNDTALRAEVAALQTADAATAINTGSLRGLGLEQPDALLGQQIGQFRVLEYLGGGGMGLVFRGERTDGIAQRVAIKIVRQELRSAASRTRFDLERSALARLEHPSIARLIDAGVTEDRRPWYVMEFVDGVPIDEYCRTRNLTLEQRLELLIEVCNAVDAAHRSLVVHRDIKPGNVLVTAQGRPKLIDFGIAKYLTSEADAANLTRDTGVLFTAHFAAPEQIAGKDISTATDVFGLGALAFLLLTGKKIFESAGKTDVDYLFVVTREEPQWPSAVSNNKALRGDLDNILRKAMAREPAERYGSASELAQDLQRFLLHRPVRAHAPSAAYRFAKFARRNRLTVALGAMLCAALVSAMAVYVTQARSVAEQRDKATYEAARATRINQFLTSMLESADPRVGDREATIGQVLDKAAAKVDEKLAGDPGIAASVLMTIANANGSQTRYAQALQSVERAIELYRRSGRHPRELAVAIGMRGEWLRTSGKVEESEAPLRESLVMLEKIAPGSVELAEAQDRVGVFLGNSKHEKAAEPLFQQSIATMRHLRVRDARFVTVLNDYGVLLGTGGRPKQALSLHQEAVAAAEAALGADHAITDDARAGLAGALANVGQYAASANVFRQITERRRKVLGPLNLDTLWGQANWANTLMDMHQPQQALPLAADAATILAQQMGESHPITLYARGIEGRANCELGNAAQGLKIINGVVERRLKLYGTDHWLVANTRTLAGYCLLQAGQLREAETILLPAIAALEKVRGSQFDRTQQAYAYIANVYGKLGDKTAEAVWRSKLHVIK